MTVLVQQVLPPEAGVDLPAEVRKALVSQGIACNLAALNVNQAATWERQATSAAEHYRALGDDGIISAVADEITQTSDSYVNQALVTLARAATGSAVYASQVAAQVISGKRASSPGPEVIMPSDVIAATGLYLPIIEFKASANAPDAATADQNAEIRRAHAELSHAITHELDGVDRDLFDDHRAAAVADPRTEVPAAFPVALYNYAMAVTWAVGVATGIDQSR